MEEIEGKKKKGAAYEAVCAMNVEQGGGKKRKREPPQILPSRQDMILPKNYGGKKKMEKKKRAMPLQLRPGIRKKGENSLLG